MPLLCCVPHVNLTGDRGRDQGGAEFPELSDGLANLGNEHFNFFAFASHRPRHLVLFADRRNRDQRRLLSDVGGIGQQLLEVVTRRVVEGESGGAPELRVEVVDLARVPGLDRQHPALGWGQHAVEPPQHRERQDDVPVLARLKVSRMRSATPQMKLTIWLWFMSGPVRNRIAGRGQSTPCVRLSAFNAVTRSNFGASETFGEDPDQPTCRAAVGAVVCCGPGHAKPRVAGATPDAPAGYLSLE